MNKTRTNNCTVDQVLQRIQRAIDVTRGGPEAFRQVTSWQLLWKYYVISENQLRLIDADLLEEHSCQISSRSYLKRWILELFGSGSGRPNTNMKNKKKKKKNNKMSSDMGSGTWSNNIGSAECLQQIHNSCGHCTTRVTRLIGSCQLGSQRYNL